MTTSGQYMDQIRQCKARVAQIEEELNQDFAKLEKLQYYSRAHLRMTDWLELDLVHRRERLARSALDTTRVKTAQGYIDMMTGVLAEGDRHVASRWEQRRAIHDVIRQKEDDITALRKEKERCEQEERTLWR